MGPEQQMNYLDLSREEAQGIVWNEDPDWEEVESKIIDASRWSLRCQDIYKYLPTEKFYAFQYSKGATEQQAEDPYEYGTEPIRVHEVHKVSKLVEVWEQVLCPSPSN